MSPRYGERPDCCGPRSATSLDQLRPTAAPRGDDDRVAATSDGTQSLATGTAGGRRSGLRAYLRWRRGTKQSWGGCSVDISSERHARERPVASRTGRGPDARAAACVAASARLPLRKRRLWRWLLHGHMLLKQPPLLVDAGTTRAVQVLPHALPGGTRRRREAGPGGPRDASACRRGTDHWKSRQPWWRMRASTTRCARRRTCRSSHTETGVTVSNGHRRNCHLSAHHLAHWCAGDPLGPPSRGMARVLPSNCWCVGGNSPGATCKCARPSRWRAACEH